MWPIDLLGIGSCDLARERGHRLVRDIWRGRALGELAMAVHAFIRTVEHQGLGKREGRGAPSDE